MQYPTRWIKLWTSPPEFGTWEQSFKSLLMTSSLFQLSESVYNYWIKFLYLPKHVDQVHCTVYSWCSSAKFHSNSNTCWHFLRNKRNAHIKCKFLIMLSLSYRQQRFIDLQQFRNKAIYTGYYLFLLFFGVDFLSKNRNSITNGGN